MSGKFAFEKEALYLVGFNVVVIVENIFQVSSGLRAERILMCLRIESSASASMPTIATTR